MPPLLALFLAVGFPSAQEPNYSQPGFESFDPNQRFASAGVFGDYGVGTTLHRRDDAGLLTMTLKTDAPANSLVWSALKDGKDLVIGRAVVPGQLLSKSFHFLNWTTCRFDFSTQLEGRTYQTHVFGSRASPAVLYRTDAPSWGLQAGDIHYDRCAYLDPQSRVRTVDSGQTIGQLGAPWMILWNRSDGHSEVAPLLVRFFNRPAEIRFDGNLQARFEHSAGAVAVMPLYGVRRIPSGLAAPWADGIPVEGARQARFWASALERYPTDLKESFSLEDGDQWVRVQDEFRYMTVADAWHFPAQDLAPVPPVGIIAKEAGYPLQWTSDVAASPVASYLGPFAYTKGSRSGYRIPVPSARDLVQVPVMDPRDPYRIDLQDFVRDMQIKPDDTSDGGLDLQLKELSQAFPLLDQDVQAQVRPKLSQAFDAAFQSPNLSTVTDPSTDCRYVMCNKIWCASEAYDREWYAGRQLDFAALYTTLVDPSALASNYRAVQGLYAYFRIYNDWAWMGTSSSVFGYALTGDGMNFAMEGMLGAAQMARRMGDEELWRNASYRAAKQAACTAASFAMAKWVQGIDYATWTDTSYDYENKRGRYDSRRMAPDQVETRFGVDIYSDKTGIKLLRPGMFWHAVSAIYWNNAALDRIYREHLYQPVGTWLTETMPKLFPDWTDGQARNHYDNSLYGSNLTIAVLDARARILGETAPDLTRDTGRLEKDIAPLYRLRLKQDIYEAGLPQVWLPVESFTFQTSTWDAAKRILKVRGVGHRDGAAYLDICLPGAQAQTGRPSSGPKPRSVLVTGEPETVRLVQGGYWRLDLRAKRGEELNVSFAY